MILLLPGAAQAVPEETDSPQKLNAPALKPALKVSALNDANEQNSEAGKVIIGQLLKEKPNAVFSFIDKMGNWYTLQQERPLNPDRSAPRFLVHPVFGSMHGNDGLAAFYRDIDLFNTDIDPRVLAEFSANALGPAAVYSNEYEYNHNIGVKIFVRPPRIKREKDKITFRFNTLCAPSPDSAKKLIFHTIEITPDYEVKVKSNSEPIQLVEIKGHKRIKPVPSAPQRNVQN